MRFWLTRGLGKPLQEQLSSQLLLGILSGQLQPGQRLPSLAQLARRLGIHANTVSLVYGDLCERGWLVSKPGSGVYVADRERITIEGFVAKWTEAAESLGFSREQLVAALTSSPSALPCLVIDPDLELARILAAELAELKGTPFEFAALAEESRTIAARSEIWCNPGRAAAVSEYLGGQTVKQIPLRSVDQLLKGVRRPDHPVMIAIVSRSQSLREWTTMLLPALGVPTDSILVRDPAKTGWQEGLSSCGIVGADIVAERELQNIASLQRIRIVAA
jgi:DNA-binding transcriptional regulator YhcF (GntR family)